MRGQLADHGLHQVVEHHDTLQATELVERDGHRLA